MDVITTHIGADFDSLAAMIAAKRLYPEAELVFPGSQEKSVRKYLAQEFPNIYAFKKLSILTSAEFNVSSWSIPAKANVSANWPVA